MLTDSDYARSKVDGAIQKHLMDIFSNESNEFDSLQFSFDYSQSFQQADLKQDPVYIIIQNICKMT